MKTTNIMIVGVGGQGSLLASKLLGRLLMNEGYEVKVSEEVSGKTKIVKLSVARSDMGKVIGRQGRIAKSIRTVVKAAAMRDDEKVIVDIDD